MVHTTASPGGVGAAASGCPYAAFVENGAAPSYLAQNADFDKVECDPNNKNCQVPANNNQGLQTNVDTPCLEEIEPDTMTCEEVALSWTLECQHSATAAKNLADGFKCGCSSDSVQKEGYCQRTCGLCSPVFVNQQVSICGMFLSSVSCACPSTSLMLSILSFLLSLNRDSDRDHL